jgi:organic hydroperoxide reductase OsmC/OhrA
MAVKLDQKSHMQVQVQVAEEAEVTNRVSDLIHAFTNGLNVYKRLRERRRKRKARKETKAVDAASNDEVQLSKSLKRGPQELAETYDACYSQTGQSFAKGDGKLHLKWSKVDVTMLIKSNSNRTRVSCRNSHQIEHRPRCHHCKLSKS